MSHCNLRARVYSCIASVVMAASACQKQLVKGFELGIRVPSERLTMHVLIVYCHPEPQSFNHAMFNAAIAEFDAAGHQVKTTDIYAMDFDAKSGRHNFKTVADPDFLKIPMEETKATAENGFADEIEQEIQKVEWCDLMIWQFPLWWVSLPAALKGWVDRVFAAKRNLRKRTLL